MTASPDQPALGDRRSRLLWAYQESLRIEQHWTDQLQNQQRRIAAVLAVNGFLLAFLAADGLQLSARPLRSWYLYPFSLSLILLSIAMIIGVLSLWPRIRIAGSRRSGARREWFRNHFLPATPSGFDDKELWLDSEEVSKRALAETEDLDRLLSDLCMRAAGNANGNLSHRDTLIRRRMFMNWQIGFVVVALMALIVALIGWGVHILTPA